MSQLQFLNVYVTERLTAAAAEISEAIERTVAELHEEISSSKEENDRLRMLLDLVFNPDIQLHRSDPQQLTLPILEEEVPPEQQHCEQEWSPSLRQEDPEWSPSLRQEDPEPTQIKEEEEEVRTSQEEERVQGLEEADIIKLIFPSACVENDCDQETHLSPHIFTKPKLWRTERGSQLTKTNEEIKTEPDGEDYRVPESTIGSQPPYAVNPDCSAAQSENRESGEVESGGLLSGSKTLKSKRKWTMKGERFHTSAGGRTDTDNMIDHLQTHTEEKLYCHVCSKSFSKSGVLKRHMRSHTEEKSYGCKECSKCFTKKVNLTYHMRIHTGVKPYRCQECGKCFSRSKTLSNHMMVHRGVKPYQCKECGKCFTESVALSRHMRVHTGEKPYWCKECGKFFTLSGTLSRHMKIHRGEKPHCCSYCGRCFNDHGNCQRHIRTVHKSESI